LKIGIIIN